MPSPIIASNPINDQSLRFYSIVKISRYAISVFALTQFAILLICEFGATIGALIGSIGTIGGGFIIGYGTIKLFNFGHLLYRMKQNIPRQNLSKFYFLVGLSTTVLAITAVSTCIISTQLKLYSGIGTTGINFFLGASSASLLWTAISSYNSFKKSKYLMDHQNWSSLHIAAKSGNSLLARFLLLRNHNVNSRNKLGETPLHIAIKYMQKKVMHLFLAKGGDINAQDAKGYTLIHLVLDTMINFPNRYGVRGAQILHELLLKPEINLNLKDSYDRRGFDVLGLLRKELIYNLTLNFNQKEALNLVNKCGLLEQFDDKSITYTISELPSFYLCLFLKNQSLEKHLPSILSVCTLNQLEDLLFVWEKYNKAQLCSILKKLSSKDLSRSIGFLSDNSLEKITIQLRALFPNHIDPKRITKLKNQVGFFKDKYKGSSDPPFEEVQKLQMGLRNSLTLLEKWRATDEKTITLLGNRLQKQICETFKTLQNILKDLETFQLDKSNQRTSRNEEIDVFKDERNVFVLVESWFNYEQKKAEEYLNCSYHRFYECGLWEGKDLAYLGISEEFEKMIQLGDKNEKSILAWKEKKQNEIQRLITIFQNTHPKAVDALIDFSNLLDNLSQSPDAGYFPKLLEADKERRKACLKAYLSQKNIPSILKEKSLSEWAENQNLKISDFFSFSVKHS